MASSTLFSVIKRKMSTIMGLQVGMRVPIGVEAERKYQNLIWEGTKGD